MAPSRIQMERVLCPIDFSEASTRALHRAERIAYSFGARLTVVHVLAPGGPSMLRTGSPHHDGATRDLERFVQPISGTGVPVETWLREGDPSRKILEAIEVLDVDLVVMGTHGRSRLERALLGSVTEKVLRQARCPVLTVGEGQEVERGGALFRRILCATDLTDSSNGTIDAALSLADREEARVTLLHVIESLPDHPQGIWLQLAVPELDSMRMHLTNAAVEQLHRAVSASAHEFAQIEERVMVGTAWRGIFQAAEETRADLIVVGTHGLGPVGRLFFGSTATQIVRHARCPVLVVRGTPLGKTSHAEVTSSARPSLR